MFTGICNLYGCTRRPKEKERLIKEQDVQRTIIELNMLVDSLYTTYDEKVWQKLNKITELKRKYFNITGKVYRRRDHYVFIDD